MALLLLSSLASPVTYTPAQLALEAHPPDAPQVPWRQFSGYVDVGERGKLFFWFVESQEDPIDDPVMLWTNGGPGCSGMLGFLTENGPFRPTPDGKLELNEYAWNKLGSMVYIEQPVGVGF